jgi:hypothetical protein
VLGRGSFWFFSYPFDLETSNEGIFGSQRTASASRGEGAGFGGGGEGRVYGRQRVLGSGRKRSRFGGQMILRVVAGRLTQSVHSMKGESDFRSRSALAGRGGQSHFRRPRLRRGARENWDSPLTKNGTTSMLPTAKRQMLRTVRVTGDGRAAEGLLGF